MLQYRAAHPFWGTFFDRAGLFDVFGSWWFVLLVTLLFVSLVACLVPRTRALWRALRTPPLQAREIDAFPRYAEVAGRGGARGGDRGRRAGCCAGGGSGWRATPTGPPSPPRRASPARSGSLAFHWAFILLLAGVVYGKGTGFSGLVAVVEGQTWIDAEANYDGTIRAGPVLRTTSPASGCVCATSASEFAPHRAADGLRLRGGPARARRLARCGRRRSG